MAKLYNLTKQFLSWAHRGRDERLAVLRQFIDENPHGYKLLAKELQEVAEEQL